MIEQRVESIELETQLHFKGRGIILATENTKYWKCEVDVHTQRIHLLRGDLFPLSCMH